MPCPRSQTLWNWKKSGLIHDDYKALYEVYINTTHCNHCKKEFKNSKDRQMDHDHKTGLFRKVVCRACNLNDAYIKYPNGFDLKKYTKEHNKEYGSKLFQCCCGDIIRTDGMARHIKGQAHTNPFRDYPKN
jgi:hypothetical protein